MLRNGTAAAPPDAATTESPGSEADSGASNGRPIQPGATPASAPPSEQGKGNDWFRNAFNAQRFGVPVSRPEAPPENEAAPKSDIAGGERDVAPASDKESSKPAVADKPGESGNNTLMLTPEELDRRVQSETDRRLAKFQREEAERRRKEERKRLRDRDPYAYAEAEREDEEKSEKIRQQLEDAHKLTASAIETYDQTVLDPLMRAIPEQEMKRILGNGVEGIPGRGRAATEALKVLERTWKEAGRAEARKVLINDQTFVKEVLARYAGQRVEPDSNPAAAAPVAGTYNINDSLREAARRVRSR